MSIFSGKIDDGTNTSLGIMASYYRLELLVTEQGAPFYPAPGTIENLSQDNAGYDLKIVVDQTPASQATLVPLGVKARMVRMTPLQDGVELVEDSHFTLEPRSSIYKTGFIMANSRGIIDRSYRGQLMAPVVSVGSNLSSIEKGTRLFQVIAPALGYIKEVAYVVSLPETVRGEGGFGSTGTK
jgi:deoxyuridine 5'-triphosphate nucleotidohydrolase